MKKILNSNIFITVNENTNMDDIIINTEEKTVYKDEYEEALLTREHENDLYKVLNIKVGNANGYLVAIYDPTKVRLLRTAKFNAGRFGERVVDMCKRYGGLACINGGGFTKAYTYQTGTYNKSEDKASCVLEFGQDGRITRIGLPDNPTSPTQWNFVDVVATETTDTNAYNDAMAEYEYQQFLYDKKQTELDAKTEEIQQQDRNLELKLQRLDSERKQITAEIDALKEVIKTNIDNSFKTFSG